MAAERGEGLGLELAYAFRGDAELRADFFQRPGVVRVQAEPEPHNGALAGGQAVQRPVEERVGFGVQGDSLRLGCRGDQPLLEGTPRVGVNHRVEGDDAVWVRTAIRCVLAGSRPGRRPVRRGWGAGPPRGE